MAARPRLVFLVVLVLCLPILVPHVHSQPTLTITVSTDKAQYSPGQTVSISGTVRDDQGKLVPEASVSVQVNDPANSLLNVESLLSDQSGGYVDPFTLPPNAASGQYSTYVSASKVGYTNGQNQTQFTVLTLTATTSTAASSTTTLATSPLSSTSLSTTTSSGTTSGGPKCLVATATFGSELAPEVAVLRNFRDFDVLQTSAGTSFMRVFNAVYYSFSPSVAPFIASHGTVSMGMKVILYPLIGILYFSTLVFAASSFNQEIAVTVAGVAASFVFGIVYFGPIFAILFRIFQKCALPPFSRVIKAISLLAIGSVIGLGLGEFVQLAGLLEAASTGLVLSSVAAGGLLAANSLSRILSHRGEP